MKPPLPAKKVAKGSEDGAVTATSAASTLLPPPSAPAPQADNTSNAQGDGKQPELAGAKVGGASLPPPPPKNYGVAKAAPTGESYRAPSWGLNEAPEASGLSLTVLKGGIEVNSISLDNRTHVLLGEVHLALSCVCVHKYHVLCVEDTDTVHSSSPRCHDNGERKRRGTHPCRTPFARVKYDHPRCDGMILMTSRCCDCSEYVGGGHGLFFCVPEPRNWITGPGAVRFGHFFCLHPIAQHNNDMNEMPLCCGYM